MRLFFLWLEVLGAWYRTEWNRMAAAHPASAKTARMQQQIEVDARGDLGQIDSFLEPEEDEDAFSTGEAVPSREASLMRAVTTPTKPHVDNLFGGFCDCEFFDLGQSFGCWGLCCDVAWGRPGGSGGEGLGSDCRGHKTEGGCKEHKNLVGQKYCSWRPAGPPGPAGQKGKIGLLGLNGPKGLNGSKGVTGAAGDIGIQGEVGVKGPKGAKGANGPEAAPFKASMFAKTTQLYVMGFVCMIATIALYLVGYMQLIENSASKKSAGDHGGEEGFDGEEEDFGEEEYEEEQK